MNGVLTMITEERYRLKLLTPSPATPDDVSGSCRTLASERTPSVSLEAPLSCRRDAGLIQRLRGKPSNRRHRQTTRQHVLGLYRQQYTDYGPTLFAEQLLTARSIAIDHETARRWLRSDDITHFEHRRRRHRRKRERRSAISELVQFDGSPHDWFEGRGAPCCLLNAIDDASGRVVLRFVPSENSADVLTRLRTYCERFDIPKALYVDHGSVFYAQGKLTRALKTLGVGMIFAHSPQAKGRVERWNRTQQDRLIKALRRNNISTIAEANQYLDAEYLPDHNERFAHT